MKKTEFIQITQIIEHIVKKEVRKQLPTIIAETLKNTMDPRSIVTEESEGEILENNIEEHQIKNKTNLKTSLKELFTGTSVMKSRVEDGEQTSQKKLKQFTKNPIYNQILNETTSDLRQRERLVGAAAFQGGYSPSMSMIPEFPSQMGSGPMMTPDEEPSFGRNVPVMPGNISKPNISEGREGNRAPLSELPTGMSVLDVAKQVQSPAVSQALTKNYSQMLKLVDKKRRGIIT